MKNKHEKHLMKRSTVVSRGLFLILSFFILSYSAIAQSGTITAHEALDTKAAIHTAPAPTLLEKLHNMYPNDQYLMKAVHMQKVLDNPSAYPQMTPADLE